MTANPSALAELSTDALARRRHLWSLRWLPLLFVLLMLGPLAAVEWRQARQDEATLLQRAQVNLQVLADVAGAGQEQFGAGMAQLLAAVGAVPMVRSSPRAPACQDYFQRLQARQPWFLGLGLIDANGRLVCGAGPQADSRDFAKRAFYRQARDENVLSVSDFLTTPDSGKPVLNFGSPVRDPRGAFKGVVFASVDLAWLSERMVPSVLPTGAQLFLTDVHGTVLAGSDPRRERVGQPLPDPVLLAAVRQRRTGLLEPVPDASALLHVVRPVRVDGRVSLFMAASVPVAGVVAPVLQQERQRQVALALVALLAGALILFLGERWVLQPLDRVLRGLRRVRKDDHGPMPASPDAAWRELWDLQHGLASLVQALDDQRAARQRTTQALRENEVRYRSLFEATPLPLWVLEMPTQRFLAVNAAAAQHYGYTLAEFQALTLADIQPPELQQVDPEVPAVRPHRKKNGEICRMQVSGQPMVFDGRPARLCLATDVTHAEAAQARVREVNEHLEQLVAEGTRELERSNRELEAFAYSVSHDLRNPVNAIAMFAELLAEHAGAVLDEQGRRYLGRIQDGTREMTLLIDELLDLSRVTRTELAMHTVHLSALAQEVVQQLRLQQPAREVQVDIEAGLHCVGDERLLRQLLVNLLGNAWKFTAHAAAPRIQLGLLQRADEPACLFVADNGAGFDMKHVDKLFEPFSRLHDARDYPGNGVGLATVKRIVGRHGGRIWATGVPGQGATFYFVLPGLQRQA